VSEQVEKGVALGFDVSERGLKLVDVAEPLLSLGCLDTFSDVGLDLVQAWQLGGVDLLKRAT
jgi:hypothetical protein